MEEESSKSNNKHKFPLVFQLNTIFTVRLMLLDVTDELIDSLYIMEAININVLQYIVSCCDGVYFNSFFPSSIFFFIVYFPKYSFLYLKYLIFFLLFYIMHIAIHTSSCLHSTKTHRHENQHDIRNTKHISKPIDNTQHTNLCIVQFGKKYEKHFLCLYKLK